MPSKKQRPAISKADFDIIASSLRADLKRKYDDAKSDPARPPTNPSTRGAFDHVPDLDSKTVAKWSSTVKKYLGCNLDPALIRRGGYKSFEDFWSDCAPRLRASCPDSAALASAMSAAS